MRYLIFFSFKNSLTNFNLMEESDRKEANFVNWDSLKGQDGYKCSVEWISMKQAIDKTTVHLKTSFILWKLFVLIDWQYRNSTSYEKCWCSHNATTCLCTFDLCLEQEFTRVYEDCPYSDRKWHAILFWRNYISYKYWDYSELYCFCSK